MDSALILKKDYDLGILKTYNSAKDLLDKSALLNTMLTNEYPIDAYLLMNRLNEISEIPFTQYIPSVQKELTVLNELTTSNDGFSLTKENDYILSCYNAMLVSLFIRMEHSNEKEIQQAIGWILKYQKFERNIETTWTGSGIIRYGGCLKLTPCYIGIVKSVIALSDFRKSKYYEYNQEIENKFQEGINYILLQKVFLRRSTEKPITNYITDLSYPFTWKTNIVEILRLLKENGYINDERCLPAINYLKSKQKTNGYWQATYGYKPKNWISFDKGRKPSLWISYEIEKILQ